MPNSESNSVIETMWSPSTCVFTRHTNRYLVNSPLRSAQERGVTFDAGSAENISDKFSVKSNHVQLEVRRICESLVSRITNVTYEKTIISRMCAYFKTDYLNRVYLLYVGYLRLREEDVVDHRFNNSPMLVINAIDSNRLNQQQQQQDTTSNSNTKNNNQPIS